MLKKATALTKENSNYMPNIVAYVRHFRFILIFIIKRKPMKKFINNLLSSKTGVSSKRFAALITLINLIVLIYVATFSSSDKIAPKFMYDALVIIVSGGLGLTVLEKIWGKGDVKVETEPEPTEPIIDDTEEPCPCKCKCPCNNE
jgi:hypothetical protein